MEKFHILNKNQEPTCFCRSSNLISKIPWDILPWPESHPPYVSICAPVSVDTKPFLVPIATSDWNDASLKSGPDPWRHFTLKHSWNQIESNNIHRPGEWTPSFQTPFECCNDSPFVTGFVVNVLPSNWEQTSLKQLGVNDRKRNYLRLERIV